MKDKIVKDYPYYHTGSDEFGGGTISIESQFPYAQSSTIRFSGNQEKEFDFEIGMPVNTTCNSITLNGKAVANKINERGNHVIANTWNDGDVMVIESEYRLKAHIQTGEESKKWVAFSYGPLALAQKLEKDVPGLEPFAGKSSEASLFENMFSKTAGNGIAFSLEDSNVSLIPYIDAMVDNTEIVTYFKLD